MGAEEGEDDLAIERQAKILRCGGEEAGNGGTEGGIVIGCAVGCYVGAGASVVSCECACRAREAV